MGGQFVCIYHDHAARDQISSRFTHLKAPPKRVRGYHETSRDSRKSGAIVRVGQLR